MLVLLHPSICRGARRRRSPVLITPTPIVVPTPDGRSTTGYLQRDCLMREPGGRLRGYFGLIFERGSVSWMTGRPEKTPSRGRSAIAKWQSNTPTLPGPAFPHFFAASIGASPRITLPGQRSRCELRKAKRPVRRTLRTEQERPRRGHFPVPLRSSPGGRQRPQILAVALRILIEKFGAAVELVHPPLVECTVAPIMCTPHTS